MTIDDKIIDEKYNKTLINKQQKYQDYLQLKSINMVKKYDHLIKAQ